MAIIVLTISAYLILAVYLPNVSFSQLSSLLPGSHNSATNSNLRTIQSNNNNNNQKELIHPLSIR